MVFITQISRHAPHAQAADFTVMDAEGRRSTK
jgi:hypothetical protein